MIRTFVIEGERLRLLGPGAAADKAVWIDLMEPTREEEDEVERLIGVGIPTREEMEEIEISSRLYSENGAHVMTATLPAHADGDSPTMSPVTFVLAGQRL